MRSCETDTLDHGIFKGPATLADAQEFLNSDSEILAGPPALRPS